MTKVVSLFSALGLLLFAIPLFAQEPDVPDFSKGIPDVSLQWKGKLEDQNLYKLKTTLSSKEFSGKLKNFLGAGWRKKTLNSEEMGFARSMGLTAKAAVDLNVYKNDKISGVEIQVFYLKHKDEKEDSNVQIFVIKSGSLIKDFGSFVSPDGTKELKVLRRDTDIVDFEVLDSKSEKKLVSDSVGWSGMRWFLYWENSSRLWGYGSDIGYFKRFEFKSDGTVTETRADDMKSVPTAVWEGLPSALQEKYSKQQGVADKAPNALQAKEGS